MIKSLFCLQYPHLPLDTNVSYHTGPLSQLKNVDDFFKKYNSGFPGRKLGFTIDLGKLHNVSLGQGQEAVAEVAMEKAAKEGHWVILQV